MLERPSEGETRSKRTGREKPQLSDQTGRGHLSACGPIAAAQEGWPVMHDAGTSILAEPRLTGAGSGELGRDARRQPEAQTAEAPQWRRLALLR